MIVTPIGGAGAIEEHARKKLFEYQQDKFHIQKIPKILPLEEVERETYKFVEKMKLRFSHPYGPSNYIPDTVKFPMQYTGVTLNGLPHGMDILELRE